MEIERIPAGVYQTNCYLVHEGENSEGFIIDPAGDFNLIKKKINSKGIKLKYIILTHGHGDHIGAVKELKEEYDVNVYIHEEDAYLLEDSNLNLSYRMSKPVELSADKLFKDKDKLEVGNMDLKFIHTPGHTKGSSCILIDSTLFSGDTLFLNSIGRTDLEGGDKNKIISSIKEKLLILPSDVKVYPGHGPGTTINNELKKNPFF